MWLCESTGPWHTDVQKWEYLAVTGKSTSTVLDMTCDAFISQANSGDSA